MNLDHIPIIDHHAHAVFHEPLWRSEPLEPMFTEAYDADIWRHHVRNNLYFQRSIADLAGFYGCEEDVEAVLAARQRCDYLELGRRFFRAANISDWLIDDGIWTDRLMSVEQCAALGPRTARVLRLEAEIAPFIQDHDSARSLFQAFNQHLEKVAPSLIGFKSIIAYRTGLDVVPHDWPAVEAAYTEFKRELRPGQIPRLNTKPLNDTLLWWALEVAAASGKPIQFHTGYGDPDLDMRLANPLHLRGLLEAPQLAGLKVVTLHCYPYVREAGYLASVYGGAYLDLGLTVPYLSVQGMRGAVQEALHLSPVSKVLFSSDAQRTPEMFWLAAKWGRKVLGQSLQGAIDDGDLRPAQAERAAEMILRGNAQQVYGL
ncbi:MAG: amidohydrolase family protein [Meiothermus sp.]|nr:amidohydrolase family protein [Meiothermus sp.]